MRWFEKKGICVVTCIGTTTVSSSEKVKELQNVFLNKEEDYSDWKGTHIIWGVKRTVVGAVPGCYMIKGVKVSRKIIDGTILTGWSGVEAINSEVIAESQINKRIALFKNLKTNINSQFHTEVGVREGEPICFYSRFIVGKTVGIYDVFIDERWRGRGILGEIIQRVNDQAVTIKAKKIELYCAKQLELSYEKLDFVTLQNFFVLERD